MATNNFIIPLIRYSVLVCRNTEGKFLCVKEAHNKGWWLPGGKVEQHESFLEAVLRECFEETLIKPEIKGIIRMDMGSFKGTRSLRTIYYAETSSNQKLKSIPDEESDSAHFLNLEEILHLRKLWRGTEIYEFPKYMSDGGQVYPLEIFKEDAKQMDI